VSLEKIFFEGLIRTGTAYSCYPLARLAICVDEPLTDIGFEKYSNIEVNMAAEIEKVTLQGIMR